MYLVTIVTVVVAILVGVTYADPTDIYEPLVGVSPLHHHHHDDDDDPVSVGAVGFVTFVAVAVVVVLESLQD